jgi:hypothetical protein
MVLAWAGSERKFPALLVFWAYQAKNGVFYPSFGVFVCFWGVFPPAFGGVFLRCYAGVLFFARFVFDVFLLRRRTTPKRGIPALANLCDFQGWS